MTLVSLSLAPLVEDDPFKFDFNESDPLKFPPQSAQVNYPHLDTRETFTIDLTKNPFGDGEMQSREKRREQRDRGRRRKRWTSEKRD